MIRLLMFLLFLVLLVTAIRWIAKKIIHRPQVPSSEKLVQCQECGIFMPLSRLTQTNTGYSCTDGHPKT